MPLRAFLELQGRKFDNAVLFGFVGDMYALIDCNARDFSILMIGMCADRANAIRAERDTGRTQCPAVVFYKFVQRFE